METPVLDPKLIYLQLDNLEAELHQLRELLKPYVTERPQKEETEHPHVERVPFPGLHPGKL